MRRLSSERGFSLIEMVISSMLTLVILGVAFTTFENALTLNDAMVELSDSSQNLRAGTNLLVRDLIQAGRNIPTGGISIPSGAGSEVIHRPSPASSSYAFDNTTATSLKTITTGSGIGPMIDGRPTDMITIIMADPFLDELQVYPADAPVARARVAIGGGSISVGDETVWLGGSVVDSIAPIKAGDLIYFNNGAGTTLQTVTDVDPATMYFQPNDPFNLNQPGAAAGSITRLMPSPAVLCNETCGPAMSIRRVLMFTYYVQEDSPGLPRLMRALNHFPAQALAGAIEDLELHYDLVDGVINPVRIPDLPYTDIGSGITYSASQIRKVNLQVVVRSETISLKKGDYLRNHLSTVVSLRNLAYVSRYDTQ
jgi:hypothetical protein